MKGQIIGEGSGEYECMTSFYDLGMQPDPESGTFIHQGVKRFQPYFGGKISQAGEKALYEYLRGRKLTKRVAESIHFPQWIRLAKTIPRYGRQEELMVRKRRCVFKEVISGKTGYDILKGNNTKGLLYAIAELARKIEFYCNEELGAFGMDLDPNYAAEQRGIFIFRNLVLCPIFERICLQAAIDSIHGRNSIIEGNIYTSLSSALKGLPQDAFVGIFDFGKVAIRGFSRKDDTTINTELDPELFM